MTDVSARVAEIVIEHDQVGYALANMGRLLASFNNHEQPAEPHDLRQRAHDSRSKLQRLGRSFRLLSTAIGAHFYHEELLLTQFEARAS